MRSYVTNSAPASRSSAIDSGKVGRTSNRGSLRLDPLAVVVEQWAEGPLEDVAFRVVTPGLEARFAEIQGGREDARAPSSA